MTDFAAITEPLSALDQEVSAVKDLGLEQIGPSTRFTTREIARLIEAFGISAARRARVAKHRIS